MDKNIITDSRPDVDQQSPLFLLIMGEGPVRGGDPRENRLNLLFKSEFPDRVAHRLHLRPVGKNNMNECVQTVRTVPAWILHPRIHVQHEVRRERN